MSNPWVIEPLDLILRLVLAVVLGGLIGFEREKSQHAAGFRTHILVCLGADLIMLLSIYGFSEFVYEENVRMDPARLAAQVVSGIGFLGAGAIIRNGLSVSGLTTAASLWVVAAIGLAVGAGFYMAAVICCLFVLISLWILNKVEKKWLRAKRYYIIKINIIDQPGSLGAVSSVLGQRGTDIRKVEISEDSDGGEEGKVWITLSVKLQKASAAMPLTEEIQQVKGVSKVIFESI